MGLGVIFLLVVLVIVVGALGGGLYALTMWLRHKQLDPEGDKIEGERQDRPRPEHVEVDNEQHARYVGTR